MNKQDALIIKASPVTVLSHVFMAAAFLVVAALFTKIDIFPRVLFAIVAGINIVLAFLARRVQITVQNDTIEVQDYIFKKSMSIKTLVSAGVLPRSEVYLRNDEGKNLSIRMVFSTQDMAKLVSILRPKIMADGVKRDKVIEKFLSKYS